MTKFYRALLYLNKFSILNSRETYKSIPIQDFTESWWDESIEQLEYRLFDKYKVPKDIQDFVLKSIQKKTEDNIINYKDI
jgi:hypothetical protein